jgi:hypothetical protein
MLADKEKAYALDPMSVKSLPAGLRHGASGVRVMPIASSRACSNCGISAYRALAANLSAHGHYGESACC